MIRAILDDLDTTYTEVGGGGVSAIAMTATDRYEVRIAQEERQDIIDYVMDLDGQGQPVIRERAERTESFR